MAKETQISIPTVVIGIASTLKKEGYEAYLVGGCVRDLLLNRPPKDWDLTTDATPEQIQATFPNSFYENDFGTVGVVSEVADPTLKVVEVTPYRTDGEYGDKRRPDSVIFGTSLSEDLKRRDFTVNAIAMSIGDISHVTVSRETVTCEMVEYSLIDEHGGVIDISRKVIRAVGSADERFKEDALRILRAIRLATELGFDMDSDVEKAIVANGELLRHISTERIRDEFSRVISSSQPAKGLEHMRRLGLLKYFLPELEEGIGIEQNKAHSFDVWTHLMKTLEHSAKKDFTFDVRLASLFHDISKPETRRRNPKNGEWTFYGHDVVGSRRTKEILKRLKFSHETVEKVSKLVRWHMFFSDTETITLSAVRRLIANVGKENIWFLMDVRTCDRIGTGRPKESPYRLRKYHSMIDEASRDPISVGMLKINGAKILEISKLTPGPKIGHILHALLEEVLEDPTLNEEAVLESMAINMSKLPDEELKQLGEKAKKAKDEEDEKIVSKIREKHWVK